MERKKCKDLNPPLINTCFLSRCCKERGHSFIRSLKNWWRIEDKLLDFRYAGIIVVQAVNVAVIINYVTHCASLRFLIIDMTCKLQDRTTTLIAAMKGNEPKLITGQSIGYEPWTSNMFALWLIDYSVCSWVNQRSQSHDELVAFVYLKALEKSEATLSVFSIPAIIVKKYASNLEKRENS